MSFCTRSSTDYEGKTFDLVVIGGGITGAGVAWDAASRGLSTALFERYDFGGQTSSGCFKIIHGGLRYLQQLDFVRLRESVREQTILRRLAPHLVHPLPFLIPCYGFGKRSKWFLDVGMSLYELLAANRNEGIASSDTLASHILLSKSRCLEFAPGLHTKALRGGVLYYDCQLSNCERFTFSVVASAKDAGARVMNYAEVTDVEVRATESGRSEILVTVFDQLSNSSFKVRSKFLVNAAGPWSGVLNDRFVDRPKRAHPEIFSKGVQVILPQISAECAVALESSHQDVSTSLHRAGRSYFIVPWRGYSLIGTADIVHHEEPDSYTITQAEIDSLVHEVGTMYSSSIIQKNNVRFAFGGLRPVEPGSEGEREPRVRKKDVFEQLSIRQEDAVTSNILSVMATKYTTFRVLATRVVDTVCKRLQIEAVSNTQAATFYGADFETLEAYVERQTLHFRSSVEREKVYQLVCEYGSRLDTIVRLIEENPTLAQPVSPSSKTLRAEIVYVTRYEAVEKLSDVLLRRTGLGTIGYPGDETTKAVAEIISHELGWDSARLDAELAIVRASFVRGNLIRV